MKQKRICLHYVRTWFAIDFVSTIPWQAIFNGSTSGTIVKFAKVGKLMRVLRLLRLAKLKRMVEKCEDVVASSILVNCFKMGKIVVTMALLCHWVACVWGWLGYPTRDQEGDVEWEPVDMSICEPGGPCEPGIWGSPWLRRYGLDSKNVASQYIIALRFATGVLTVSEFGIQPGWWGEHVFVTVAMFFSFIICSMVISMIFEMFARIRQDKLEQEELMMTFRESMVAGQVPLVLQVKVKRYLEFQFSSRKNVQVKRSAMMEHLSPWLRKELLVHLNSKTLQEHPFFRLMPIDILSHTCCLVRTVLAAPGDVIMQYGQINDAMYFVVRGQINIASKTRAHRMSSDVTDEEGIEIESSEYTDIKGVLMAAPGYFGAKSIVTEKRVCPYTVISITHTELLKLERADFHTIKLEFPAMRKYIAKFTSQSDNMPDTSFDNEETRGPNRITFLGDLLGRMSTFSAVSAASTT